MVLIAAVGTHAVFSLLQLRWRQPLAAALLLIGLGAVAYLPQKEVQGFRETVQVALRELDPSVRSVWMVSSDARGEGAVIAEAAFLLPRRVPSPLRIYRAGKELGSSDWLGRGYQSAFTDHSTLLAHLDTLGVQWVFLDQSLPEKARVAHELLLAAALQSAPDRWHLVHQQTVTRQPGVKGPLLLYRSLANTPPSAP